MALAPNFSLHGHNSADNNPVTVKRAKCDFAPSEPEIALPFPHRATSVWHHRNLTWATKIPPGGLPKQRAKGSKPRNVT
jgi:hypothetical protein